MEAILSLSFGLLSLAKREETIYGTWMSQNLSRGSDTLDSVCKIVHQGGEKPHYRCQFSWWCDGRSDEPVHETSWKKSVEIAREIYSGKSIDPTGGALWYHAEYVSPYWQSEFEQGPKIGQHIFYLATRKNN